MHSNSQWERKLNIITSAAYHEKEDANHSPYEPTDYAVLQRLAESGYITAENTLVDYGSGKGRVGFFMANATGCKTVGVEYSEELYRDALKNLESFSGRKTTGDRISFVCENAENYLPEGADRFYFFNPFSVKILRTVIRRITDEYYADPRDMYLFFYYALDSYTGDLMTEASLEYAGEIDCRDIFQRDDHRERILIFRVTG